jgi:hypothetical protein
MGFGITLMKNGMRPEQGKNIYFALLILFHTYPLALAVALLSHTI